MPSTPEAELESLRARNAELTAALDHRRRGRLRASGSWMLLVLACLLAVLAVVANWSRREIVDTNRYVQTVAPLASHPAIQTLLTDRLTAALADPTRTADFARGVLPPKAAPLATPLATALQRFVHDKIGQFVRSPQFASLWAGVSRRTHAAAVRLLTGESHGPLHTAGNLLVVELGPLLPPVKAVLTRAGVDLPVQTSATGQPQLVLADASALEQARGAVRAIKAIAVLLPLAALLALAGSVALAADRRRGVLRGGIGLAVAMATLAVALAVGRSIYLDAVVTPGFHHDAAAAFFDTILRFVRLALRIALALGVVIALAAVLAGPSRAAVALRAGVRSLGRRSDEAVVSFGWLGRSVGPHRRAIEWWLAGLAAIALVALGAPTAAGVVVIGLALLLAVGLVELVAATWTSRGG